jgi:hypothetical protein
MLQQQGNLSRGSYDEDFDAALQTKRSAAAAAKQQAQAGDWKLDWWCSVTHLCDVTICVMHDVFQCDTIVCPPLNSHPLASLECPCVFPIAIKHDIGTHDVSQCQSRSCGLPRPRL